MNCELAPFFSRSACIIILLARLRHCLGTFTTTEPPLLAEQTAETQKRRKQGEDARGATSDQVRRDNRRDIWPELKVWEKPGHVSHTHIALYVYHKTQVSTG
jgi:hypothetical protein